MGKGIKGIKFIDDPIGSGQVIKLPDLNGCPVYGLMANGLEIQVEADIDEQTRENLAKLGKDSQVKWVTGEVKHLEENGIVWHRVYIDTNKNKKKEKDEKWKYENNDRELKKISKTDEYNIETFYERTNSLDLKFPKTEKFKPNIYWVEPFLIYPELHFSNSPKGFFLISIDIPRPYNLYLSGENFKKQYIFYQLNNKKEEREPYFFYGDTVFLEIDCVHVPAYGKLEIEVLDSQDKVVSDSPFDVLTTNAISYVFDDMDLNKYARDIFTRATIYIPLDIAYKPDSHKQKTLDYLKFRVTYKLPEPALSPSKDIYEKTTLVNSTTSVYIDETKKNEVAYKREQLREQSKSKETKEQEKANAFKEIPLEVYFPVFYNDTEEYILSREADVSNQMLQISQELKQAPENDPCHYTKITAQRIEKNTILDLFPDIITIFDENGYEDATNMREIHVISGDERPTELKIKLDLDTNNNCAIGKHNIGGKTVFNLDSRTSQLQGLVEGKDYVVTQDQITLYPRYIYVKDTIPIFPLNYFCLLNAKPITYFIPIETCRYKHLLKTMVYPDLEFWVEVAYNANDDYRRHIYRDESYGYRIGRGKAYNKKHQTKYEIARSRQDTKDGHKKYSIGAGYRYNGEEYTLAEAVSPILQILDFGMAVYDIINELSGSKDISKTLTDSIKHNKKSVEVRRDNDPGNNKLDKRYAARQHLPLQIKVDRPSISGAICGKFMPSKKEPNKVGYYYALELQADPLIKVKGSLDMLFYAQFIPYVGQAIKAINEVISNVNLLTFGVVNIDYYINLVMTGAINIGGDAVYYHSIDGWDGLNNIEVNIPISIGVEAGVSMSVDMKFSPATKNDSKALDAKAHIDGTASVDINLGYDAVKEKAEASVIFNGLEAEIYVKLKVKGNKEGEENEENKPFRRKVINEKEPWKIEILDLSSR